MSADTTFDLKNVVVNAEININDVEVHVDRVVYNVNTCYHYGFNFRHILLKTMGLVSIFQ